MTKQYLHSDAADATSVVNENLGTVEISKGSSEEALAGALPQNAEVNLAYDMGTSSLPVVWDTKSADLNQAGTYEVTGTVQSISSNKDAWTGKDGSTNYLGAPTRRLSGAGLGRQRRALCTAWLRRLTTPSAGVCFRRVRSRTCQVLRHSRRLEHPA